MANMTMSGVQPSRVGIGLAIVALLLFGGYMMLSLSNRPLDSHLPEGQIVTGSGGARDIRAVYSTTVFSTSSADNMPDQKFHEFLSDGYRHLTRSAFDKAKLGELGSALVLTDVEKLYYPQYELDREITHGDAWEMWFDARDAYTHTETAESVMTGRRDRDGWADVQIFINAGALTYLGSATTCGLASRGAEWIRPDGAAVEAWFADPDGLRLATEVEKAGITVKAEECITASVTADLINSDFELDMPTIWNTMTLEIREIDLQSPGVVHGYTPTVITASMAYTVVNTYVIDRRYEGVYSYDYADWSEAGIYDTTDTIGWMVVQDLLNAQDKLIRIVQNNGTADPPYGRFYGWPYREIAATPVPDPGEGISVPGTSNPIIR